jgi:hypothetical protein
VVEDLHLHLCKQSVLALKIIHMYREPYIRAYARCVYSVFSKETKTHAHTHTHILTHTAVYSGV